MKGFQLWFVTLVTLVFMGLQSVFLVQESERAVILRFGKFVDNQSKEALVYSPGLHLKYPFIDQIYRMDARMQTKDVESDKIQNVEQVYLVVDFFLKWKVDDFARFFRVNSAGGIKSWLVAKRNAEQLINQKVKNAVLIEFGQRTLAELIAEERVDVMNAFSQALDQSLQDLGIKLIDIRLKRIDLPEEVSERVYNRMRTHREKVAAMHRAQGKEQSEKIRANTDAEKKIILAQAQRAAEKIKGEGDAQAAEIYANAYSQHPDFFAYLKNLEAYEKTFNTKNDLLILRADRKFFSKLEPEDLK